MNRAYRTDGTYNTCRSDKEAKAAVSRRRRVGRANRISAIPFFIGSFLLIAICCLVFNTFFVSAQMCIRDRYISIRKSLKKLLKKERYEHTLGVMYTAASLAM